VTMTTPSTTARVPALRRVDAMRLAATEYQRVLDLLRSLQPQDWSRPTDCSGWDVRAIAAHMLGMVELAASMRENRRQVELAERRGGVFIDALTELQVDERADMTPTQIIDRFAVRASKAVRNRQRTPGVIRRRIMPVRQLVGDHEEAWTAGYLIDVILTRDPWMHRADIVRATGATHVVTPEHDGRLVADIVSEWATGMASSTSCTSPDRPAVTGPRAGVPRLSRSTPSSSAARFPGAERPRAYSPRKSRSDTSTFGGKRHENSPTASRRQHPQ
jgi:uncharacterized protein (TIGR03083 family)